MQTGTVVIIVATLSGLAMALQGTLNSFLGKIVGQLEATFIVHVIATVLVAIFLFIFSLGKGELSNIFNAPWYSYLGGVLNVLILYGVIYSIPKLGVANATAAIVSGQVGTAILIDHFGLFGLDKVSFQWIQLLGLVLLAIGTKMIFIR